MVDATTARCRATTVTGSPCSAQPIRGDGYCYWHSPDLAVEREEARRRGGRGKSNKARARRQLPAEAMSAEEVHAWLGIVFKRVIGGAMEPGVATAAANVARAMVVVREAGAVDAMQGRLDDLEAAAARRGGAA